MRRRFPLSEGGIGFVAADPRKEFDVIARQSGQIAFGQQADTQPGRERGAIGRRLAHRMAPDRPAQRIGLQLQQKIAGAAAIDR